LQFVQIRNSSSFTQQSAKFIPKQLLQNKPQRKPSGVHTAQEIVRQRWMPWRTMSDDVVRSVNTA